MNIKQFALGALLAALVFSLGMFAAAYAAGPSATLSWTNPTLYEDGQALSLAELKTIVITWYRPGSTTPVNSVTVNQPATTTVVNGLVCGDFEFTAKVTTTATAKFPNDTSRETNRASYTTQVTCHANPPSGLTVS